MTNSSNRNLTIALVSVLKPVDDVRSYHKMGKSLAMAGHDIHLLGVDSQALPIDRSVTFHPLGAYDRSIKGRYQKVRKIWGKLIKLSPDVILFNGIDTLILMPLCKRKFGSICIEDVQEDMLKNVMHSEHLRKSAIRIRALSVKTLRATARPFTDYWLLAERCYLQEMALPKKRCTIVENKALDLGKLADSKLGKRYRLIYAGTISKLYGIWEAVELSAALHSIDPRYTLQIVGFAPERELLKGLREKIADHPFITLTNSDLPLPHSQIMAAMVSADACLLSYHHNPSVSGCIPTKLYECLSIRLPMLIPENQLWKDLTAGLSIDLDYANFKASDVHQRLQSMALPSGPLNENVWWDSKGFASLLEHLIKPQK